jgi:hypothetical protein
VLGRPAALRQRLLVFIAAGLSGIFASSIAELKASGVRE